MARGSNSRDGRTARSELGREDRRDLDGEPRSSGRIDRRGQEGYDAEIALDDYRPSDYTGELKNFRDSNQNSGRMRDYYAAEQLIKSFNVRKEIEDRLVNDFYEKEDNGDSTMDISASVDLPYRGSVFTFSVEMDTSGMEIEDVIVVVKDLFSRYEGQTPLKDDYDPLYGMTVVKTNKR
jgi:hypothetical protein